jgi:hypothetical protein
MKAKSEYKDGELPVTKLFVSNYARDLLTLKIKYQLLVVIKNKRSNYFCLSGNLHLFDKIDGNH